MGICDNLPLVEHIRKMKKKAEDFNAFVNTPDEAASIVRPCQRLDRGSKQPQQDWPISHFMPLWC